MRFKNTRRSLWIFLLIAPLVGAQDAPPEETEEEPLDVGIVERTGQRLVQIDVSFQAKKKSVGVEFPELTPDDFHLVVNTRPVEIEHADRICNITREETLVAVPGEPAAPAEPLAPRQRSTFIFYLEHTLLTMRGQNIALDMTERMIRELIVDGNRGMVVSSGGKVLQSEYSNEPEELLKMIETIKKDTKQWSEYAYAQGEAERYENIFNQPSDGAQRIAARAFQLEEMRVTTNRLNRLSAMIGGMAEIDPPKAVFYFADMARQRPGEHYIRLFTASKDEILGPYTEGGSTLSHGFGFDHVLEEANAQGVRLYTIQAQGRQPLLAGAARTPNQAPSIRIREAEDTLRSFSAETGGTMFFGGVDSQTLGKIRRKIEEDYGCFYLLSFYPTDMPEDSLLRVVLMLNETDAGKAAERDFNYRTRGQLVVQSQRKREESMLLAAHAASETIESDPGRGVVIPLAFSDGTYQALVQFVVRGSDLAAQLASDGLWDLGMTHVFGPDVKGKVAGRIGVEDASAPVVLETLWRFDPGESEIVSVGREHRMGQLATAQMKLEWPNPNQAPATVSPIALVQQYDGVFVRKSGEEEEVRYSGTLGVGPGLVDIDRPAYLIELICRGRRARQDLWIQRRLAGESAADFELLRWEFEGERCIQVRDLIHQGQMGWGEFSYTVAVYDNEGLEGEPIAIAEREFSALGLDDEPATSQ